MEAISLATRLQTLRLSIIDLFPVCLGHAPLYLSVLRAGLRMPGVQTVLGIFSRGAMEPRISDPGTAGPHRPHMPERRAFPALLPRGHRAPELPEGPCGCLVSPGEVGGGPSPTPIALWSNGADVGHNHIAGLLTRSGIIFSTGAEGGKPIIMVCVAVMSRLWSI